MSYLFNEKIAKNDIVFKKNYTSLLNKLINLLMINNKKEILYLINSHEEILLEYL